MFVTVWKWSKTVVEHVRGRFGVFFFATLDSKPVLFTLILVCTVQVLEGLLKASGVEGTIVVIGWVIGVSGGIIVVWLVAWLFRSNEDNMSLGVVYVSQSGFSRINWWVIILLVSSSVFLGGLRVYFDLSLERGQRRLVEGFTALEDIEGWYIASEPRLGHDSARVSFATLQDVGVRVDVKVPRLPNLEIGQVCSLGGGVSPPQNFGDFDYEGFLWSRRVYVVARNVSADCLEVSKVRRGSWVKNSLVDFKRYLVSKMEKNIPEPQVSLLAGIILGENRVFSDDFDGSLRVSGTTHIVAASGYNVTILVLAVQKLFRILSRRWRLVLSIAFIWGFAVMSGLSASIVRATIMGTIVLISSLLGRKVDVSYVLLMSVAVFMLVNPRIGFDVGFQLSIAATLGLVYLSPLLSKAFRRVGNGSAKGFLDEYFVTTLSATIATIPVSVSTFGVLSVISPVANVLVLPVLESTLLYGVIALLTGFKLVYMVVWMQLKYFEEVVRFFGGLDWVSFEVDVDSGFAVYAYLAMFVIIILFYTPDESSYYHRAFVG